jgi:glycosyltransferase involved in cell wall biosynthesis
VRLCLVTREFPPFTSYTGGIGRRYAALAPTLVGLGHEVHAVVVGDNGPREADHDGVAMHVLRRPYPDHISFPQDVVATLSVDRALRRLGRFDVVFCPEWAGNAWLYSRHKRSGPLVTNLATSYAQVRELTPALRPKVQGRVRELLQPRLERAQTERSDGILACSHALLDWARRLWDIDGVPSAVVPNFIDLDRTRGQARAHGPPPGWPQRGPVVGFAGRLERRKGVHTLVDAMRSVWGQRPEVELALMGSDTWDGGRVSDQLRKAARPHADRVHLLGHQHSGPLLAGLARADIVALPSVWEAFGIVALEAMAVGRPVVVTSDSGFEEFVRAGRDGLIVPPRDAEALAEALRRLLDDAALRQRLGSSAASRAEQFTATAIAPRYVDHFRSIASSGAC